VLARNAYLNLHKLGAVGQKYAVSYFGPESPHAMLSDDRLVVNWWVAHQHAASHAEGRAPKLNLETLQDRGALNETTFNDDLLRPEGVLTPEHSTLLLEIPMDYVALEKRDGGLARAWRDHLREAFTTAFAAGYLATDFIREGDRTYYVFTRDDGSFRFS
jgi:predicted GNAT superfamily acetyltransferase